MSCEQVGDLLGAFHDGEVTPRARAAIEAHLAVCPTCAAALATMTELRELARGLPEPEPPGDLWEQLAPRLEEGPAWRSRPLRGRWAALAALVLVSLAAGWWVLQRAKRTDRQPPASTISAAADVDLSPFLDHPHMADAGTSLSSTEASRLVHFPVLSAPCLGDYCRQGCCLCRGSRCNPVACTYCRGQERVLVIQCPPGQSVVFGNHAVLCTHMNGKPTQIVQGKDCLAAAWQVNGSSVSVIGPHDMAELVQLMAHVDASMTRGQ